MEVPYEKKWYDYLWIASLAYLILGFSTFYLHGWDSSASSSPSPSPRHRKQGILQPLLRPRPALGASSAAGYTYPGAGPLPVFSAQRASGTDSLHFS